MSQTFNSSPSSRTTGRTFLQLLQISVLLRTVPKHLWFSSPCRCGSVPRNFPNYFLNRVQPVYRKPPSSRFRVTSSSRERASHVCSFSAASGFSTLVSQGKGRGWLRRPGNINSEVAAAVSSHLGQSYCINGLSAPQSEKYKPPVKSPEVTPAHGRPTSLDVSLLLRPSCLVLASFFACTDLLERLRKATELSL